MSATISRYIECDLAERIGAGQTLPAALTLHSLSRHYGVSATPVREAIRNLLVEGVLVRLDNGRLDVNRQCPPNTRAKKEQGARLAALPTRPPDLDSLLEAEVIRKSLRGEGDYLREEATAERLGVGRTALRPVLQRLAGRGLIVHVPRCGWRVRTFDEADMYDYLEIREVLETKALTLARPHLVESDLRKMLAGNRSTQNGADLDNSLHNYLVEKSGNHYLREFFGHHAAYHSALLEFAAPQTQVVATMARQHRKILRALLAKDWRAARRELTRHIRAQRSIVRDLLQKVGKDPSAPESPDKTS